MLTTSENIGDYYMPNNMKDSGIEWIGDIPEGWELRRLQFCLKEVKVNNNPIQTTQVLSLMKDVGVLPYEEKGDVGNKSKEDVSEYHLAFPNTIVLNCMNILIGSVGISGYFGCVSPVYYVFRETDESNLRYVNYVFNTRELQKELRKYAKGILEIRLRVSADDIFKRKIPFPSKSVQKRIADTLDCKCSEIDALRADIEKEIATLEEYKKSVITEAVTKGLNSNVEMKESGIPWIGKIPAHWGIYRIADLYEDRNERGNDELSLLSVSINSGVSDKELSDEEQERVFLRSEDKTKYKRVYPGDITYNMMRAWQGAFGAVRVDGMVSPAYVVAKRTDRAEIDSRYIEALFRSPMGIEEMNRYSYGIMDFRKRLYWPQFRVIQICLPDIEEQKRISDFIDVKSKEIEDAIELMHNEITALETYKKSVIYEYVTGKKEVSV